MFIADKDLKKEIIEVVESSEKILFVVSPYIDIDDSTKKAFKELHDNVSKIIIYRDNSSVNTAAGISEQSRRFFKSLPFVELVAVKDLHAKVYLNERFAVISSMNLTKSSNENFEVGWNIDAEEESEDFFELWGYIMHILESDKCDFSEERFKNIIPKKPFIIDKEGPKVLINGREVEDEVFRNLHKSCNVKHGICIRCSNTSLEFYTRRPLCLSCFKEWNIYKNPYFKENYCHRCGLEFKTDLNSPLCDSCNHVFLFEMEREWKKFNEHI